MKLATLRDGSRDGRLIVVSADTKRFMPVGESHTTLQSALEQWTEIEPLLLKLFTQLNEGAGDAVKRITLAAPLPRAWQWLDGSAFRSHGELMEKLFGAEPAPLNPPLMYQGMSHQFLAGTDDVPLPREADGIDFEGEFGVIVDEVPMGTRAADAMAHIKLIVQINDWSLRMFAGAEMKTGFGWVRAKPACSAAPFAVTPDELGAYWRDGRVHLNLNVEWNGVRFGNAHGGAMGHGFHQLIEHAASTRTLCAGTIIGSGTVANRNYEEVGSSCIAERRAIEILSNGAASTEFMRFGDRVRMNAQLPNGQALFGEINQKVIAHQPIDGRARQ